MSSCQGRPTQYPTVLLHQNKNIYNVRKKCFFISDYFTDSLCSYPRGPPANFSKIHSSNK